MISVRYSAPILIALKLILQNLSSQGLATVGEERRHIYIHKPAFRMSVLKVSVCFRSPIYIKFGQLIKK